MVEAGPGKQRVDLPGEQPGGVVQAGGGCAARAAAAGDLCPRCGEGRLDYDGTLNLFCPACGEKLDGGGAFT